MLPQIGLSLSKKMGILFGIMGTSAGAVMETFISDEGTFIQGGGLERIAAPRESLVAYPKTVERLRSSKAS